KASWAPATIGGARLSIGPVMSPRMPSLTSSASAGTAAPSTEAATARPKILFRLFIISLCDDCGASALLAGGVFPRRNDDAGTVRAPLRAIMHILREGVTRFRPRALGACALLLNAA